MELNLEGKAPRSRRRRNPEIPRKWIRGGCRKCRKPEINHGRLLCPVCYGEEHKARRLNLWPKAQPTDLTDTREELPERKPAAPSPAPSTACAAPAPAAPASLEALLEGAFELFSKSGVALDAAGHARIAVVLFDAWDKRRALTDDFPRPLGAHPMPRETECRA